MSSYAREGPLAERYNSFIIDLDGVLYLLNDPIPGAAETVNELTAAGRPIVFLTNNSSATPEQYVEKLARFRIKLEPAQVVTSSQAVGRYLDGKGNLDGSTGYVIGEEGLLEEIRSRSIALPEGEKALESDFVFVGWDRAFSFEKLKTAVVAIRRGAEFIATNADATYPTPGGLWPGAGSLVAAVATGAGKEPLIAGKPNPTIVELALERMGSTPEETLLIGDRLDSDILAGLAASVDTLLVLTGVSTVDEIELTGIKPTHVRSSLADMLLD
jgi:4-nitrophenyl phosphatase